MRAQIHRQIESWRTLYPFESHFANIAGERFHYLDEFSGDRPIGTLLFVHGNPSWSFHWRGLITAFRADFRCVAVDHLGCGLSAAPETTYRLADRIDHLIEFIDQADISNATLVAQDWGGAIGLGALLERRDRFEQIVLLNTGAFRPWFIPLRIRACRTPLFGRLAIQIGNVFSKAAIRMAVSRQLLPRDVRAGYLAPYDSWGRRRAVYDFVQDIPLRPSHPTWNTLGRIEDRLPSLADMPSLLVWGMQDWCFTPACLDKFRGLLPRADVCVLDDAGHWVVEDATDQVIQSMRTFLRHELPVSANQGSAAEDVHE